MTELLTLKDFKTFLFDQNKPRNPNSFDPLIGLQHEIGVLNVFFIQICYRNEIFPTSSDIEVDGNVYNAQDISFTTAGNVFCLLEKCQANLS